MTLAVLDFFTTLPDDSSSLGPVSRDLTGIPPVQLDHFSPLSVFSNPLTLAQADKSVCECSLTTCTKLILISGGKDVLISSALEADT